MSLEAYRQQLLIWLDGLNRRTLSEVLHLNLLLASLASVALANRPFLMALANIVDYILFGVGQRQRRCRGGYLAWFRGLVRQAMYNVVHFTDEIIITNSTLNIDDLSPGEYINESPNKKVKTVLGLSDASNDGNTYATTTTSTRDSAFDDNRTTILGTSPKTEEQLDRYRQRELSRWRLACALIVVWIRILAGGEKSTLIYYYFYL
jgi:hypothetical protein